MQSPDRGSGQGAERASPDRKREACHQPGLHRQASETRHLRAPWVSSGV